MVGFLLEGKREGGFPQPPIVRFVWVLFVIARIGFTHQPRKGLYTKIQILPKTKIQALLIVYIYIYY